MRTRPAEVFGGLRGLGRRNGSAQRIQGVAIEGVADDRRFAATLRRERDRADRIRDVFSLGVMELTQAHRSDSRWWHCLERILSDRLRSTDEAGWLGDSRLGIALPHTAEDGAWALLDELRKRLVELRPRSPLPRFSVYSYDGGRGPGDRNGFELHAPEDGLRVAAVRRNGHSQRAGVSPRRAIPLEALLLEPLGRGKRLVDIALASVGLVLSVPIVAAAALAIKLTSRGPVFFSQQRAGLGGRPFRFYKLRTMVAGAERLRPELSALNELDGPAFKIAHDPRLSPVGHFLRVTSIDELPQLWNVLRGDMSIVGPRPPTLDEVPHYQRWQRRRLLVKGGLTCLWQVSGRNQLGFTEWMRLDLRYLRRRSPWLDLKLILRTIPTVLTCRGAK